MKKFDLKALKQKLSSEQYHICCEHGTERAFTGRYWQDYGPGIYHCIICDQPLFDAAHQYNSGTGWPSFYQPIHGEAIGTSEDNRLGMKRIEVHCANCGAHLGHVFPDGPEPTGLRYCINSAALNKK